MSSKFLSSSDDNFLQCARAREYGASTTLSSPRDASSPFPEDADAHPAPGQHWAGQGAYPGVPGRTRGVPARHCRAQHVPPRPPALLPCCQRQQQLPFMMASPSTFRARPRARQNTFGVALASALCITARSTNHRWAFPLVVSRIACSRSRGWLGSTAAQQQRAITTTAQNL